MAGTPRDPADDERALDLEARLARAEERLRERDIEIAAANLRYHEAFRELESYRQGSLGRRVLRELRRGTRGYVCELKASGRRVPTVPESFATEWITLRPISGRFAAGWVELDFELRDEHPEDAPFPPTMYADDGSGIVAHIPTPFPEVVDGRARGIVKLPDRVTDLFLEVGPDPERVRLGALKLRELSRTGAALRLGLPLAGPVLRDAVRGEGLVPSVVESYRTEGWAAAKRRFRDAMFERGEIVDYATWLRVWDELTPADREQIAKRSGVLAEKVGFTVVLLASSDDDPAAVEQAVRSCDEQLFPRWSGVVVAGEADAPVEALHGGVGGRERWAWPPVRTREALLDALQGSIAVFLRPGEALAPHALYLLAETFVNHPEADLAYADEDRLVGDRRESPSFKPDWSPYRLAGQDYVRHRFACRAALLATSLPERLGPASPLRVLLASARAGTNVQHVPFVLWHVGREARPDTDQVRATVEEHLAATIPGARLEPGKLPGTFRIRPPLPVERPLVTIVIPTRNRLDLLRRCVDTIHENTRYRPFELLICDNDSDDPATRQYLAELQASGAARVLEVPGAFNFAAINNRGVSEARGGVVALLNNDIEVHDPGWLDELVAWALVEAVGAVGCRLTYADGRLQHAGVVLGLEGLAAHEHRLLGRDDPGRDGAAWVLRDVAALTAACLVIRKDVYQGVGGMDEVLRVAFNDVELCLRLRERGLALVFTPFAELLHLESASRGKDRSPDRQAKTAAEAAHVLARHGPRAAIDPYYNPNFSGFRDGALARSARIRKPWRDPGSGHRRIAFLTYRLMKGFGVDVVVAEQVEYFCARGWYVTVIVLEKDTQYDAALAPYVAMGRLRILTVASFDEAVRRTIALAPDVAIAHTPPFYEVLRRLPPSVCRVLFDHGEPPAELFTDAERRRAVAAAKVEISRVVNLSVAISEFIRVDSGLENVWVCRNGNDHLLRRRSNLARLAGSFRERHGLGDAFVVLNVTRFLRDERRYKGVEDYVRIRQELLREHPELEGRVRFVLAGRAEPPDRAWAEREGLVAVPNLDDDSLLAAYLDADLYVSMSRWEGYNLGVAQALALGVPTLASAAGAHPEFPIRTCDDPHELSRWVAEEVARAAAGPRNPLRRLRGAAVEPWRRSTSRLEALIESTLRGTGTTGRAAPATQPAEEPAPRPELSIVILNKDKPDLLEPCLASIEERCDVAYEVLIGDTGSTNAATLRLYETTRHQVHYLGFYNFSACNNVLAARARGRYLLFLNNDTKLLETRFAEAIAYLDAHADVGCVGGYLAYADGTIQHAGVRICPQAPYRGIPEHFDKLRPIDGYPGRERPRDVVAVTGAMLLIAADRFRDAGGFDEVYREEAQDIDLCLRLRRAGLRSVMHPALYAYHYENATRTVKEAPGDRAEFLGRFGDEIEREIYRWQQEAGLG